MVSRLRRVWQCDADGRISGGASRNSDGRGLRNYAQGFRAGLCLLLLAATALFGLAGCASSNSSSSTTTPTPAITFLNPTSGTVGTAVTITGNNFGATQGTSTVTFNGTAAATVTSWSATVIVVPVPVGATTGNVVVTVGGVATNGSAFTVLATPAITSLSPTSGGVGAAVTITGTNFGATQGTSTVTFNGTAAAAASTWSATSIVVTVPTGATTGNVVVTVSGVASNGSAFTVLGAPTITSLNPTSGPVGSAVTITGTNFGATQGTSTVTFNGTSAGTATSWSATSIVVTVPTGATTGNVVANISGVPSNGSSFTVLPIPTITNLNPTSGAVGTPVTITGTNFGATQGSNTVTFNGTSAGTATSWSATSIVTTVPVGATTGNVVVTVSGVASAGSPFTPGPSITALSQNAGLVGSAITITGVNFGATQGTSTVTFNGLTAGTATTWSSTSITVSVPASATTGNLVVTTNSLPSNALTFTIVSTVLSSCANAPTGDESKLNGHYVFLVQGWTGTGLGAPFSTVTNFIANGSGGITGGEGDTNGQTNGAHHFTINATGGLYKLGKDPTGAGDLGCVVLPNSLSGSNTYTFSVGKSNGTVYTKGRLLQWTDTTGTGTRGSGVMLLQTAPFGYPSAPVNLVFGESGWDATSQPFSGAGFVTMSSSGAFSNLSADFNDAGSINFGLGATTPISGAVNNGGFNAAPDATAGYTTATVNFTVSSATDTFNFALYQVNTNEYFLISTDAISASAPLASGRVILSGSNFTNSSLSGNYVIHETGSTSATAEIALGLLTFTPANPSGTLAATLYGYQQGSPFSLGSFSSGYAIASGSGRVTFPGSVGTPPLLYATTPNANTEPISAFVVGTDTGSTFGFLEPSAGAGFTTAGLAGNYFFGSENPGDNTVSDQLGAVVVTGALGTCNGTGYSSGSSGLGSFPLTSCSVAITNPNGQGNAGTGSVSIDNGEAMFFFLQSGPAFITVIEKQ